MYDTEGRYCPKHPTLVHPCQICANPSSVVNPDSPDGTVVNQVNWQFESQIPYNTTAPHREKHDPQRHLAERLGLDDHLDDPRDRVPPPPLLPDSA